VDKVVVAERELRQIEDEINALIAELKERERRLEVLRERHDQLRHFVRLADSLFPRREGVVGALAQLFAEEKQSRGLVAALRSHSQEQAVQRAAEDLRAQTSSAHARAESASQHAASLAGTLGVGMPSAVVLGRGIGTRSHRERIANAVAEILKIEGTKSTRELLPLLKMRGIDVGTSSPTGYLSVILSRDDRFKSDRATGWSLVDDQRAEAEKEEDPAGASTPAGSSE
jgi:hypothetical protein